MRPVGTIQSVRMERRAVVARIGLRSSPPASLIPTQSVVTQAADVPVVDEEADAVILTRGVWVPPTPEEED